MIRTIRVELTRLRWRRAVLVLTLIALVIPLLFAVITAWSTRPVSAGERAQAQEQLEAALADPSYEREIARCVKHPDRYGAEHEVTAGRAPDVETACRQMMEPQLEWFVQRYPLELGDVRAGAGLAVVLIVTALCVLAGTTFAGADWHSGSMSNQLLFEPRRIRVWAAKGIAVAVGAAALMLIVLAVFWGILYAVAGARDLALDPTARAALPGDVLRAVALAAGGSLAAYALTMLSRSTVFTVGVLFALVVGSSLFFGLIPAVDRERWSPAVNLGAWLNHGMDYYRFVSPSCFEGNGPPAGLDCRENGTVTLGQSALYLGGLLIASVAASLWSFTRRDVP